MAKATAQGAEFDFVVLQSSERLPLLLPINRQHRVQPFLREGQLGRHLFQFLRELAEFRFRVRRELLFRQERGAVDGAADEFSVFSEVVMSAVGAEGVVAEQAVGGGVGVFRDL